MKLPPNRLASDNPATKVVSGSGGDTRARLIGQLRTTMIEKKMTQAQLADAADCHEKTVQNLLGGRTVRDQTLFDVCVVLGLDYEDFRDSWHGSVAQHGVLPSDLHNPIQSNGLERDSQSPSTMELKATGGMIAPVYMGAYTRAAVDQYLGSYVTLRADFQTPGKIVAYRTDITWDPDWPSLLFQECERPDAPYSHRGRLYVPASSMFIHLVSLTKGAMRMIVVSQLDREGVMRGLITTLNKQRATYVPISTPIVYAKRDVFCANTLGEISPGHASYEAYQGLLTETVSEGYARLL
jgi:DNA-binding Xre family transcriptional regulator